jgi:excisionase family DNA binding protein
MIRARTPQSDLISLRQASEILGVHPSTLRVWADQGKLKVVRTVGGHRRFSTKELRAFAERNHGPHETQNAQLIVHSALGRTRMELTDGHLARHEWYQMYDEAKRERHREMGRKLLGLLMHYLNTRDDHAQAERILREGRKLGGKYGTLAARQGLSLGDAMRAFLFFRDSLLESVVQMREVVGSADTNSLASYRLVNSFANEVLVAMVTSFQEK